LGRGIIGGSFTELNGLFAAVAWTGFMGIDHADIAEVIKIIEFLIDPGLIFDDFEIVCIWESAPCNLKVPLAVPLIEPDGEGHIGREQRVDPAVIRLDRIDVASVVAIRRNLIDLVQFLGQTDNASTDRDSVGVLTGFGTILRAR